MSNLFPDGGQLIRQFSATCEVVMCTKSSQHRLSGPNTCAVTQNTLKITVCLWCLVCVGVCGLCGAWCVERGVLCCLLCVWCFVLLCVVVVLVVVGCGCCCWLWLLLVVVVVVVWCGPCADSKRFRVYVQNVPVCTGNRSTCSKHVDLFLVHTGTF